MNEQSLKSNTIPPRLLLVTQAVDKNDPALGFFHRWVEEFAKRCEVVTVICLREGEHYLPENVRVFSLGGEGGSAPLTPTLSLERERGQLQNQPLNSSSSPIPGRGCPTGQVRGSEGFSKSLARLRYSLRFLRFVIRERKKYDAAFVHMNQEYVLLGGWFWRLWGKQVLMWRNHRMGSWLTNLTGAFCNRVFCTSEFSYTAKWQKTTQMPVGIDTEHFKPSSDVVRMPASILCLGRIAPVKKLEGVLEALALLQKRGVAFQAAFYGDPLPRDAEYDASLKRYVAEHSLSACVSFHHSVPNADTPAIYTAHEIFINNTPSGALDKTMFEAAACECLVIAPSADFGKMAGVRFQVPDNNPTTLADRLAEFLALPEAEKRRTAANLRAMVVADHSLASLVEKVLGFVRVFS